ncbi:monovalent cation/H(+) antiporter subunit G [Pelagicoccus mobilis]|uniref:Monovalent cation/H(+) antiporter subunit G n=1 Tax=Pelagicoccus mobilis TaxID=415221 RepID=A0A934S4H7_9BACT|nr:monovalent cation/H(+) antiporter subunit G [Pelagicoccus mobilis]MBK1879204.1 monovalent cation/H(+) antiporter subunit G [Pelagicoccus mobilis]
MNYLIAITIIVGSSFALIAAIGTIRLPDTMSRMHAATKAGAFGASLLLVAAALHFQTLTVVVESILIIGLFYLTAPIAAQLIGHSARNPSSYDTKEHTLRK